MSLFKRSTFTRMVSFFDLATLFFRIWLSERLLSKKALWERFPLPFFALRLYLQLQAVQFLPQFQSLYLILVQKLSLQFRLPEAFLVFAELADI